MENKIIDGLCQVHNNLKEEKRNACTSAYFDKLKDLMPKGCVIYSKFETKCGEWLFDLIWSQEKKKDWTNFDGLYLVCESEWDMDFDALLMDFQKLMVAKANIKLFICQGLKHKTHKELFDMLTDKIKTSFKSTTEKWILFISDDSDMPSCWVWTYNDANKMIPVFNNVVEYVWE